MIHKHLILIIIFFAINSVLFLNKSISKNRKLAYINKNITFNNDVIVAVIDTGIDYSHPALRGRIWINDKEDLNKDGKCTKEDFDGIDQDGNGYVDDCNGWNFAANTNNPMDTHGHGTHIAGIISAITKNHQDSKISIMPLKYYDPASTNNHIKNTVNAIDYAVKMGAKIINYSAGGGTPSDEEKAAITRAKESGVLFVAAAGNEKKDVTLVPYYPASYSLKNIISVAALDKNGNLISKSNWGKTIDIAAPGLNVLSTIPKNKYGNMSGTSMAASFVSGLISLLVAEGMTPLKAADHVRNNATRSNKLYAKVSHNRIISPQKVLKKTTHNKLTRRIAQIFKEASAL